MSKTLPIVLTMGEPAGIGGELSLRAWEASHGDGPAFFVIDDPERLTNIARHHDWQIPVAPIDDPGRTAGVFADALPVLPLGTRVRATAGQPSSENAAAVMTSIERAIEVVSRGQAAAMVTNPIQKEILYRAGFPFPGHTEYLAKLAGGGHDPVMMLASPMLRVVPVTVHVSLRDALDRLDTELIANQGRMTLAALRRDFGIARPRLAVAGLNPHAGEGGALGDEENTLIRPAIESLAQETDAEITGPVPPDALFTERARQGYDAALCMYHDQALIPIKALDFDRAVNVTLGLPIVRTSPDHGTALDIAGSGTADSASLLAAIRLAADIADNRRRAQGASGD